MTFVILSLFVVSQLWGRGVPLDQTLIVCSLVGLQIVVGALLWIFCTKPAKVSQIELFAIGMVLGPIGCTITDQLLLGFGIRGLGTIVTALVAIPISLVSRLWRSVALDPSNFKLIYVILCSALTALAIDESFTTPALLLLAASFLAQRFHLSPRIQAGFAMFIMFISGALTRATLSITSNAGILTPLFTTASDDQIKSEQLSYSIAHWGLFSNSAAIDLPIKFHWLSLGWAGSLMNIGAIDPFVVTLHLVPILALLGIGALMITVAVKMNLNFWIVLIAPFLLLASTNGDSHGIFYFVVTTTNLVPHLWILALVVAIIEYQRKGRRAVLLIIAGLPPSILLGKGPYGIVISCGLILVLISAFRHKDQRNRRLQLAILASLFLSVVAYFLFLNSPLTDSYYVSLHELVDRFPFPLPPTIAGYPAQLAIGFLLLGVLIATRFTWVFHPSFLLDGHIGFLVIGGSVAGLASFVFKQIGSETYFLNAATTLSSVGILIALNRLMITKPSGGITLSIFLIVSATLVFSVARLLIEDVRIMFVMTLLLAIVGGLVFASVRELPLTSVLMISCAVTPIFAGFSNIKVQPNTYLEIVSAEEQRAFTWVRQNIDENAIFITDRFLCPDRVRCGSGMPVVTAFTQRRLLLEGARTLTPTRMWDEKYPSQLRDAAKLTLSFAEFPSEETLTLLREESVTHALVYRETTQQWQSQPKITEIYRSKHISIFSLTRKSEDGVVLAP